MSVSLRSLFAALAAALFVGLALWFDGHDPALNSAVGLLSWGFALLALALVEWAPLSAALRESERRAAIRDEPPAGDTP